MSQPEEQAYESPIPKAVFFIVANELCERFAYYGLRAILVIYLTRSLLYSDDAATIIFHVFSFLAYFWPILGAIISDSWWGKFKTIFYLSIVYLVGCAVVALSAVPNLKLPASAIAIIGLILVAIGSGAIKPCVAAFGGDQFKLPEQAKQITLFFFMFYFAINVGSLMSTVLTPILREVHCFGEKECFSLAFGVTAAVMFIALAVLLMGKPWYKNVPPSGNMVVLVTKAISNAIATRLKERKTNPREHWMDYADKKYDKKLVDDTKVLLRVLWLFIPLPVFWALFDQQGSRWTLQATRMDGDVGIFVIKPDQFQVVNPLLILILIPMFNWAFYPLLALVGIRRPLQKLTLGGISAGIAFIISALVEFQLEKTYPILPQPDYIQLRIFNAEKCELSITTNIPGITTISVPPYGYYEEKNVPVKNVFKMDYSFPAGSDCGSFAAGSHEFEEKKAYTLFVGSNGKNPLVWFEDEVAKPKKGLPHVRALANVAEDVTIVFKPISKTNKEIYEESGGEHSLMELPFGQYAILVGGKEVETTYFKTGGVYAVMITDEGSKAYKVRITELVAPNSVHMLWLFPQYLIITMGEVMFSITGLDFSYAQAPVSMKSVLQACWLLTVALGNVIVVAVAKLKLFESQANEFLLFASLMLVDMGLFGLMAFKYVPNNPATED